jgi:DNA mismatch repair ATPase MutS
MLRNLLENPAKGIEKIQRRQYAIRELAQKLEFCQSLQCEGLDCEGLSSNPEKLLAYAEDGVPLFKFRWLQGFFYVIPGITILSFGMLYFERSLFFIPLCCLLIQIIVNLLGFRKVNGVLAAIYSYKRKIEVYQCLFALIEREDFSDEYLSQLQSNLSDKGEAASQQIKKLDRVVDAASIRYNPLIHIILNNVLFWDYHCAFALQKWKEHSGSSLRKWIDTLGMFEALSGMALIAQLNPEWCYPQFEENGPFITAEEMGHPLITEVNRVTNELVIKNQICVITGSNMSGKTTLLRTTGINLVLAYAGAPVCAKEFRCSVMDIFTSMRINDDLNSGISTFYAELLRIKMIIDHAKQNRPMLFLIDEVFRGTNSRDRVTGARSVVMNLNRPWIIGLISTHDFELCDFEKDPSGRIINYHFLETYSANEINFDYKLRPGRCKTANARYLMKMVGIDLM